MPQQLIARLQHVTDLQPQLRRDILHMQTLVVLRTRFQRVEDPPRRHAEHVERGSGTSATGCVPVAAVLLLLLALLSTTVDTGRTLLGGRGGELLRRAPRKIQMRVRRFEQMVLDLIVVCQRTDDVGADVAFVVEGLEAAPDAGVGVFDEARFGGVGAVGGVHAGREVAAGLGVDPEFDLHCAGAVVEFVGYVCGLG